MATIKRESAEIKQGILNQASGAIPPIVLQKNNVVRVRRLSVKRRRRK